MLISPHPVFVGLKVDIGTEVIETETGIRVIATRKSIRGNGTLGAWSFWSRMKTFTLTSE